MDERITRLRTAEECEQFALNVATRHPDLALLARRRAIELKAATFGAKTDAEREALVALVAYECVLSQRNGKKVRASRTWPMIKKYGIIGTVERVVSRDADPSGYTALAEMGLTDLAFEAVVLRHQSLFSKEAIAQSSQRLERWDKTVKNNDSAQ